MMVGDIHLFNGNIVYNSFDSYSTLLIVAS
jgi:hypothetical protein